MIGTGDVMSNVGQLIEFLTDLKSKLQFLGIHEIKFIKKILGHTQYKIYNKILGCTLYERHILILNAQECNTPD